MRTAQISRTTKETDISISLSLDGTGVTSIKTGVGFFDHMLTAFAVHGGFNLEVSCAGDLEVDCHHTIEDVGIVLGKAFLAAIGERKNITRYGNMMLPMDEALALCAVDISGREYLVFDCPFTYPKMGEMDTQMVEEFFRAFANNAGITLHIKLLYGSNDHHKAEAVFKGVAHALKAAVKKTDNQVLSTKGSL